MTRRGKIAFPGHDGGTLAGLLESPDGQPRATALFAHCFTCGKDIAAASRIVRALVARGVEVLRFDVTGLGNSDGDFANTHLDDVVVTLRHEREHSRDCDGCGEEPRRIDVLTRTVELAGDLDDAARVSPLRIADRCPVHRTLEGPLEIRTRLAGG